MQIGKYYTDIIFCGEMDNPFLKCTQFLKASSGVMQERKEKENIVSVFFFFNTELFFLTAFNISIWKLSTESMYFYLKE